MSNIKSIRENVMHDTLKHSMASYEVTESDLREAFSLGANKSNAEFHKMLAIIRKRKFEKTGKYGGK